MANSTNLISIVNRINKLVDPSVDLPKRIVGGEPRKPANIYKDNLYKARKAVDSINSMLEDGGFKNRTGGRTWFFGSKGGRIEKGQFDKFTAGMLKSIADKQNMKKNVYDKITLDMVQAIHEEAMEAVGEDLENLPEVLVDKLEERIRANPAWASLMNDKEKADDFKFVVAGAILAKAQESSSIEVTGDLLAAMQNFVTKDSAKSAKEQQARQDLLSVCADIRLAEPENRAYIQNAYPLMKDMGVDMSIHSITKLVDIKDGHASDIGYDNWADFATQQISFYGQDSVAQNALTEIQKDGNVTTRKVRAVVESTYADLLQEERNKKTLQFIQLFTSPEVQEQDFDMLEVLADKEQQKMGFSSMLAKMKPGYKETDTEKEKPVLSLAWERVHRSLQNGASIEGMRKLTAMNITDFNAPKLEALLDMDNDQKEEQRKEARQIAVYINALHADEPEKGIKEYFSRAGHAPDELKSSAIKLIRSEVVALRRHGKENVDSWQKKMEFTDEQKKTLGITDDASLTQKLFDTGMVKVAHAQKDGKLNNMVIKIDLDKLTSDARTPETLTSLALLSQSVKGVVLTGGTLAQPKSVTSLENLAAYIPDYKAQFESKFDDALEASMKILTELKTKKHTPAKKISLARDRGHKAWFEPFMKNHMYEHEAMIGKDGAIENTHIMDLQGMLTEFGLDFEKYKNTVRSLSEGKLQWDNRFVDIGSYQEYVLMLLDLLALFSDGDTTEEGRGKLQNAGQIIAKLGEKIKTHEDKQKLEQTLKAYTEKAETMHTIVADIKALNELEKETSKQDVEKTVDKIAEALKQFDETLAIDESLTVEQKIAKINAAQSVIQTQTRDSYVAFCDTTIDVFGLPVSQESTDKRDQNLDRLFGQVAEGLEIKTDELPDAIDKDKIQLPVEVVEEEAPAEEVPTEEVPTEEVLVEEVVEEEIPVPAGVVVTEAVAPTVEAPAPEVGEPIVETLQATSLEVAVAIKQGITSIPGYEKVSIIFDDTEKIVFDTETAQYDEDGNIIVAMHVPASFAATGLTSEQIRKNETIINNSLLGFAAFNPVNKMANINVDYIKTLYGETAGDAIEQFEQELYARLLTGNYDLLDKLQQNALWIDLALEKNEEAFVTLKEILDEYNLDKNFERVRNRLRDEVLIKPEMLMAFRESSSGMSGIASAVAGTWNDRSSMLDTAFATIQEMRVNCEKKIKYSNRRIRYAFIVKARVARFA